MLRIDIEGSEQWDEATETFIETKPIKLSLEHSLLSISKWESRWKKPFLDNHDKSREELLDYIRCMTITTNVPDEVYTGLSAENLNRITDYINDPMTATTFHNRGPKGGNGEIVTSEIVYYWMTTFNIPFECEKWHFKRLITLIEVCALKSQPPKKMSKRDVIARNASLNAARRAKLNSKG